MPENLLCVPMTCFISASKLTVGFSTVFFGHIFIKFGLTRHSNSLVQILHGNGNSCGGNAESETKATVMRKRDKVTNGKVFEEKPHAKLQFRRFFFLIN